MKEKDIPIPELLVYDDTCTIISNKYLIMTYISGQKWRSALKEINTGNRAELLYQLGKYTATIHSVTGEKFGYVKSDKSLLFDTWGEAFYAMMQTILEDGRKRKFPLPHGRIKQLVQQYIPLLNQVVTPCLVDFDLWAGNIFLDNTEYNRIAGIIDLGNSFYGDPFAEFVSAVHLYKDVKQEREFQRGYEKVIGQPFVVTKADEIRMELYRLYLNTIVYVESYRYEEKHGEKTREKMLKAIEAHILWLETKNYISLK